MQLDYYWIESVTLKSNPDEPESPRQIADLSYAVAHADLPEPDRDERLARLRIRTPRGALLKTGLELDLTIVGRFSIKGGKVDADAVQLLKFNGPAILYGVARGIISSLTAISGSGRTDLPSANFVD